MNKEENGEEKCPCGFNKGHYMVTPVNQYKAMDWFWVLMGITTTPKKIIYKCRQCQTVISVTTNMDELKKNS